MNKRLVVSVVFVILVIVVAISFSSSQANLLEMQDRDRYMENIIASQQSSLVNLENGSPLLGSESAPVTIVEFGDYQCEMCYSWFHNTRGTIIDNYVDTGKVNIVFVDLAFLGSDSPIASQATHCADDQGKFWEYHSILYYKQEGIDNGWASKSMLKEYANELKLDSDQFADCIDSGKYAKNVQDNYNLAVKLMEYPSTPTFYLFNHSTLMIE
mgnify:CR=1 FL=1